KPASDSRSRLPSWRGVSATFAAGSTSCASTRVVLLGGHRIRLRLGARVRGGASRNRQAGVVHEPHAYRRRLCQCVLAAREAASQKADCQLLKADSYPQSTAIGFTGHTVPPRASA